MSGCHKVGILNMLLNKFIELSDLFITEAEIKASDRFQIYQTREFYHPNNSK